MKGKFRSTLIRVLYKQRSAQFGYFIIKHLTDFDAAAAEEDDEDDGSSSGSEEDDDL